MKRLRLFALNSSQEFGEEVGRHLGVLLTKHEEFCFDDGEAYCASLENVRGCDVFVIQSLYSDENESISDKLVKLLIFLGSLRDASAKRVTVVSPYLGFARQDRKTTSRAPITTKYLSRLLKRLWAKRILTLDVHSPTAIQNAYPFPEDLLEAKNLFASHCCHVIATQGVKEVVVLSPDVGGLYRARKFRNALAQIAPCRISPLVACMDKEHEGKEIKGYDIMCHEPIRDKSVIIYDDMISSGKTNLECVEACRRNEAKEVLLSCATHGLFVGRANEYLDQPFLKHIAVTDTVRPWRLTNASVKKKLNIINTTSLFAEAIRRIHQNESISDLIENHR